MSCARPRTAEWAGSLRRSRIAAILEELAKGKDDPSIALCQDLLENARRRAAQGRFDDALARLYRLVEARVQTQLFVRWRLKSGELDEVDVPPDIRRGLKPVFIERLRRRVYQLPLDRTVRLLRHRDPEDKVAAAYGDRGPPWLSLRNKSILAHGYHAISATVVSDAFAWIGETLAPAMGFTPMPPFPITPF